jgi:NADH-quinone oxidoreductase subunit L
MTIGSLALAGIPGFSGYFSKEAILTAVYDSPAPTAGFALALLCLTVLLTAFYSWRLMFAVFWGPSHAGAEVGDGDSHGHRAQHHGHGRATLMALVVALLGVGAVTSGFVGDKLLVGNAEAAFWAKTIVLLPDPAALPLALQLIITSLAVLGILGAYACYVVWPSLPGRVATTLAPLDTFFRNKWGFDSLYQQYFVRGSRTAGRRLAQTVDGSWIDGLFVNKIVTITHSIAKSCGETQTGLINDYALTMITGVTMIGAAMVAWWL